MSTESTTPAFPEASSAPAAVAGGAESSCRERIAALEAEDARLDAASRRCASLRMGGFLAVLLGLLAAAVSWLYPLAVAAPGLILFLVAFALHARVLDRREAVAVDLALLREESERRRSRRRGRDAPPVAADAGGLEAGLRVFAPEPESFPLEPWAADDLDVLGGGRSLFSFLDASSTPFGARRLRRMLLHPLRSPSDVKGRQQAIGEIAAESGARRRLLAALVRARRRNLAPLLGIFGAESRFARRRGLRLAAHALGTLAPLSLLFVIVSGRLEMIAAVVLLVILNLVLIARHAREANRERDVLLLLGPFLETSLEIEGILDEEALEAAAWKDLRRVLAALRPSALRLGRALRLISFHDYGLIFEVVNALTLWELRLLPRAAALFESHRRELEAAAGALGEAEAFVSLALPLAEQGDFILPEVIAQPPGGAPGGVAPRPFVEAEDMGHPLLEPGGVVGNPLALGGGANVWIVTGSNMSGKSTYLKACASNVLLAGIGGPVRARRFRWTPLALHCDMNVRDSLDDGKSYFQVEVERVRAIVRAAEKSPMLLAVFDELFRGTSSTERVAIAGAVIRHFRGTGALVLVATHDRSLAELVSAASAAGEAGIANRHLRETVVDGVMRFDYVLRQGEATTRNAIRVLEAQGYPAGIIEEARRRAEAPPAAPAPPRTPSRG